MTGIHLISNNIFVRKYSPSIPAVFLFLLLAACDARPARVTPPNLPADEWVRDAAPILTAGTIGADGWLDISIADPDALYDPVEDIWHVWYQAGRAKEYTAVENRMVIRHAWNDDGGASWTVDPDPAA
jgi:hypothetical protein